MNYDELSIELNRLRGLQIDCHSDYSWWRYESAIDDLDVQLGKIMKSQAEILVRRFTAKRAQNYINDLVETEILAENARKAKEKLEI